MKSVAVILVLLPLFVSAGEVSGTITEANNHWGATGSVSSPVDFYGASVPLGVEITIDAGTEVRIMSNSLRFDPNVVTAVGTVDNPILFTPVDAVPALGDWLTVRMDSAYATAGTFSFCHFRYMSFELDHMDASRPVTFDHCIFDRNFTTAIDVNNSNPSIVNCTFYSSVPGGDGITLQNCSTPVTIRNCIFAELPNGINCFSSSGAGISYCLSDGDLVPFNCGSVGPGNQIGSALFVDVRSGDFRLRPTDPGIDMGDPADEYSLEPTCGGQNTRINMGAFGNTPLATCKEEDSVLPRALQSIAVDKGDIRAVYSLKGRLLSASDLGRPTMLPVSVYVLETSPAHRYRVVSRTIYLK
ncbi:MAG: hypothetical protein GF331_02685 [Chitinivibrionales bacterium]|nr:hypothetical protein [Chitinivibrionales bacterium]